MKVLTVLFATMLFVASSFASYSYGSVKKTVNTGIKVSCDKTCCKSSKGQEEPSGDKQQDCCNNNICSQVSSNNYYLILQTSNLAKRFGLALEKFTPQTQLFNLNNFINAVFQPPEA